MPAYEVYVSGKVQQVGFRAYVLGLVEDENIGGEVHNCLDGRVRMVLEHSDDILLRRVIERLKEGPGRVDSVQVFETVSHSDTSFRIGPTRNA